jgi:dihydroorotase
MNEGVLSGVLGLRGWPAVAEEAIVARDVLLAEHVGSRLHVCHVSTAGSVELIRWAKSRGIDVTAEVTPHHLLLTDELAATYDPPEVNPSCAGDVLALRAAPRRHHRRVARPAPHSRTDCEWSRRPSACSASRPALSVVAETMVADCLLDWAGVADRMSVRPARIGRVGDHGRPLAAGEPANVVLVDPTARWTVVPAELASLSGNTPYRGRELPARIVATFLRGRATVLEGALA